MQNLWDGVLATASRKVSCDRVEVLIVEDNESYVWLIGKYLSGADSTLFNTTTALNLHDAFEHVKEKCFDVILLDLNLPDSTGIQTFLKIHKIILDVPFVLLTGLDDEELAIDAIQKGAQDYLVKGEFNRSLLVRATRYAMERNRLTLAISV